MSSNLIDEVVRVRAVYEYGPDRVRAQVVPVGREDTQDLILPRENHPRVGDHLQITVTATEPPQEG